MIIVYISGVWDLFHVGHLNAIRNARRLGDMLIVGVVTDEFCEQYKGERPIISFEQRRAIVEALRDVNVTVPVTSFDLPPLEYRVSIRAHGPEYGKHNGQKMLLKKLVDLGIEAVYVPRTDGISTTIIKERIVTNEKTCACSSVDFDSGGIVCDNQRFACVCGHSIGGRACNSLDVAGDGGLPE